MASLTAPFLVYNLGCEMLFIIDQRLRAQHSSNERSATVLLDLAEGLLQEDLMEAHFAAQPCPHMSYVYDIFVKVIKSTVMRLSTTSMDRLFDLMLMGVKLMVCGCMHPEGLLQSSLWHLDGMKAILDATGSRTGTPGSNGIAAVDQLEFCKAKFVRVYGTLTQGQMYRLRTELLHFFCNSTIKVSMYLTEGIQSSDGQFFLRKPVRAAGVPVGTVKTVRAGNYTVDRVNLAFMEEPDSNYFCHPTVMGENFYRKDRIPVMPPPRSNYLGNPARGGRVKTPTITASEHKPSVYAGNAEPGQLQPAKTGNAVARTKGFQQCDDAEVVTARSEVQLLSSLSSTKVRHDAGKLDLFIEEDATEAPAQAPQESNVIRVETVGRGSYSSHLEGMASAVANQGESGGTLDLLAMMDDEV